MSFAINDVFPKNLVQCDLDNLILRITIHNATTNDALMKRFIEACVKLMNKGQFLHINCVSSGLNLLVHLKL